MNQLESLFEVIGNIAESNENKREAENKVDSLFHEEMLDSINQCIQIFNNPVAKEYSVSLGAIKINWCLKETSQFKVINWRKSPYKEIFEILQDAYLRLLYTSTPQVQKLAAQGLSLLIGAKNNKNLASMIQSIVKGINITDGSIPIPCLGTFIEIFADGRIDKSTDRSKLPSEMGIILDSALYAFHNSTIDEEVDTIIEFLSSFISNTPLVFWYNDTIDSILTATFNRLCDADINQFITLHDLLFEVAKSIYPSEELSEDTIKRIYGMIETGFNTDDIEFKSAAVSFWHRFCKFERSLPIRECKKYCIAASESALPYLTDILINTPPINHLDESGTDEIDREIFFSIREMFILSPPDVFYFVKDKIKELITSGNAPESTCILIAALTPIESYDNTVLKLLNKSFNFIIQAIGNGIVWHGIQVLEEICKNYIDLFRDDTYIVTMLTTISSLVTDATPAMLLCDICKLLIMFLDHIPQPVADAYCVPIAEITTSISTLPSIIQSEFVGCTLEVIAKLIFNTSVESFEFCQQFAVSCFQNLMENIDKVLEIRYETMFRTQQLRVIAIAYRKVKSLFQDGAFPPCPLIERASDILVGMLKITHDQKAEVEIDAMYVIENLVAIFPDLAARHKEDIFSTLSVVFDRQSPEQIGQACVIYSKFLEHNAEKFASEIGATFNRIYALIEIDEVDHFRFYFTEALEALSDVVKTANKIGEMDPNAEEKYANRLIEIASEDQFIASKNEPEEVEHFYVVMAQCFRKLISNKYGDFDIVEMIYNGIYKLFDGAYKCKCYNDATVSEMVELYKDMIDAAPVGFMAYHQHGLKCRRTPMQEYVLKACQSRNGNLKGRGVNAKKLMDHL